LETIFFTVGIKNSTLLISIFVLRKYRFDLILRFGWIYLLPAVPAIYGIVMPILDKAPRYAIFPVIFLVFLLLERLLDYRLKIS
jgi:hypothetical protein